MKKKDIDFDRIFFPKKNKKKSIPTIIFLVLITALAFIYYDSSVVNEQTSVIPVPANEKTIIQEFVQENIQARYEPDSLDFEAISIEDKIVYTSEWTSNNVEFSTSLQYNGDANPDMMLTSQQTNITNLDINIFAPIANKFFKTVQFVERGWKCRQAGLTRVCETSWLDGENRIAIGIQDIMNSDAGVLYACKIPSGSNKYHQDTCILVE